jgi:hypothetical protein
MKWALVAATTVALAGAALVAQRPPIQNGQVDTRQATDVASALSSLSGPEPTWAAWTVPMIDGEGTHCMWFVDDDVVSRGFPMESTTGTGRPQFTTPSGPVPLEAGTALVVYVRMVDGHPERLRTLTDDCPVDAGGRSLVWLEGITPAASLRYLESLTPIDERSTSLARRLSDAAVSAIALHRDPAADAVLDRLAASADSGLRRQAASALGRARGAHGFETVRRLLGTEKDASVRRSLTNALGYTRQPGTAEALLSLARADQDVAVRAEAVYWYAVRAGAAGLGQVTTIIGQDASDSVKRRGVDGIARLPADVSVPQLIDLVRGSDSLAVRKAAVSALGRTKDPRAIAFLEDLLKR